MAEPAQAPHKRVPNSFYWDHNECAWMQAEAGQSYEGMSVPGAVPGPQDHHSARDHDHVRANQAARPH